MASQILYPGALGNEATVYRMPLGASSIPGIVGAPPQWGDDDDATYAQLETDWTVSNFVIASRPRTDMAGAPLDALSVTSSTATLDSYTFHLRVSAISTTHPLGRIEVAVGLYRADSWDDYYGYLAEGMQAASLSLTPGTGSQSSDVEWLASDSAGWLRHGDTGAPFTAPEILDFFASGQVRAVGYVFNSGINSNGSFVNVGRVYDFWVTVNYTPAGGDEGIPQPFRPRQRLHPIAPARRWPREAWEGSSSRRVGGYR